MIMNSGMPSQKSFEEIYATQGKNVFVFELVDMAEMRGRNKDTRPKNMRAQPSDYLVTDRGHMFYAEVKSTVDKKAFKICQLSTNQKATAVQQQAAGGDYFVFIHSLATDDWYKVPAKYLTGLGKSRATWAELKPYKWSLAYA